MFFQTSSTSLIAEGSSSNLKAAVEAGLGNGNVPEIFDYFKTLNK
jgi:3-hydroxyisobutyrate dehydrogenase